MDDIIGRLFDAELLFRLSITVNLSAHKETLPLEVPSTWVYGKHVVEAREIFLRKEDQAPRAAAVLEHCATFILAMEIKNAIEQAFPQNRNLEKHENILVRNSYVIVTLIRNAFAHNPFKPVWLIDRNVKNEIFEVENIITLNTKDLNGKNVRWQDYGGHLAILKLAHFVRFEILKDSGKKPWDREFIES